MLTSPLSRNADAFISVRPAGSWIPFNDLHFSNALTPISVTLAGILTLLIALS